MSDTYDKRKTHDQGKVLEPGKRSRLKCTFCGASQDEVAKVIAGPSIYICNFCVDVCNVVFSDVNIRVEPSPTQMPQLSLDDPRLKNPKLHSFQEADKCAFCGKAKEKVDGLIGDKESCICNECVGLCNEILDEELFERQPGTKLRMDQRGDVLETVVRQAMFGTRWYTICADIMKQQGVSVDDVKQEVSRQLAVRSTEFIDVVVDGNMRPDQKSLLVLAKIYSQLEEIGDRLTRLEQKS